jgi:hypothetical protein
MVALTFVALLAAGIVLSLTTALRVWRLTTEQNELNQESRAIMELLTRDLRGAFLGNSRDGGFFLGGVPESKRGVAVTQYPNQTPVDPLFFTTDSSSANEVSLLPEEVQQQWDQQEEPPTSDAMAVRWEWREAATGQEAQAAGLYRTTAVILSPEPESFISEQTGELSGQVSSELISESVRGLRFRFYDGEQKQWVGYWDSRDPWDSQRPTQWRRVPQAVAIELTLLDPGAAATERARSVSNPSARTHVFTTIVTLATR